MHKLIVTEDVLARKGFGVAVLASNAHAGFMFPCASMPDTQCIWIRCTKELFGCNTDVLFGAAYLPPQASGVYSIFLNLADWIARRLQETPNIVICGDLNGKVGNLNEITDAHNGALLHCPSLQAPRLCECREVNDAGLFFGGYSCCL